MTSNVGYNASSANLSSFEVATAGASSGFITRMIIQPLDVLKIRFQLQVESTRRGGGGRYQGLLQAGHLVVREEGVRALWKGHVAAQALTVLYGAGQFGTYNTLTRILQERNREQSQLHKCQHECSASFDNSQNNIQSSNNNNNNNNLSCSNAQSCSNTQSNCSSNPQSSNTKCTIVALSAAELSLCGFSSGVCGTLVSMPCDVARTRIVAQSTMKYRGLLDVWRQMLAQEGARSLFRGLLPTLASSAPYSAIQFPVYTALMDLTREWDTQTGVLCRSSVSGTVAGLVAKLVVYPLDLLKKRAQLMGAEQSRHQFGQVVVYRNTLDIIRQVTRQEGASAWFKGLSPALLKGATVSGLSFVTYEVACQCLLYVHSGDSDEGD